MFFDRINQSSIATGAVTVTSIHLDHVAFELKPFFSRFRVITV